jgi:hypothetical protein
MTYAAVLFFMLISGADAQWREFTSREWRFTLNFPAEPVSRALTYTSPQGADLKAQAFSVDENNARYTITVVDFTPRSAEESGAIAHAAATIRQRGRVTYDGPDDFDGIPGHQLSLTEPNGWHTRVGIYFYNHFLYIIDASVAPGVAPPAQFQQSIDILNPDGTIVDLEMEVR